MKQLDSGKFFKCKTCYCKTLSNIKAKFYWLESSPIYLSLHTLNRYKYNYPTWVAFIVYVSGWYSLLKSTGNRSLVLIPRLYNSFSPSLINSPPLSFPFQGDLHPFIQEGTFCKDKLLSFAACTRVSMLTDKASNAFIFFLVGARVPCLACEPKCLLKKTNFYRIIYFVHV